MTNTYVRRLALVITLSGYGACSTGSNDEGSGDTFTTNGSDDVSSAGGDSAGMNSVSPTLAPDSPTLGGVESSAPDEPAAGSDLGPADVEPADVEPADVGPADVEPADVGPAVVEPAVVEPADVGPADVEPADVEPADVEPDPVQVGGSGCDGSANPPTGVQTLDVDGTERSYIVSLPEGYTPQTPFPLVFAFHGLGGSAAQVSRSFYFGIEQTGGTPTIFVYPDGLDTGDGAGWANTGGRDVAFFDAMLNQMQQTYCVDSQRVFSTGHSYGGMMSHTLGCQRANVLRGIAPVAGALFSNGQCTGPIAAWGAHGDPDDTVAYDNGLAAITRVLETNGCDLTSGTPVDPTDNCTLYDCDAGYPVTWCIHDEGHGWPQFAASSIKQFIDSF